MSSIQSIADIKSLLRRRAALIIFVAALGSVISVIVALNMPQTYSSSAVIQIETPQVRIDAADRSAPDAAMRLQLIEQRLMARDNLVSLIDEYALFKETPDMPLVKQIAVLRKSILIEQINQQLEPYGPATTPTGLRVTVQLNDPQKAADIANELVEGVIIENRDRQLESARETLQFFSTEEERLRSAIAGIEARIAEFKRANSQSLPDNVTELRGQITTLEETALELDRRMLDLQPESSRQRATVLERQVEALTEQITLIENRIAGLRAAIADAPRVERRLGALQRERNQLQDRYEVVARNRVEAELTRLLEDRQQQERFEIIETAVPSDIPVSGSRKQVAALGGMLSLMAAVGLALLLEMLKPVLRSAAQVERELGLVPVVSIPTIKRSHELRARAIKAVLAFIAVLGGLILLARFLPDRTLPMR